MDNIRLLGVRIDKISMSDAIARIDEFIAIGGPHMVVTADASAVVIAQNDEEFRRTVNEADMVTPDSAGILLAAKWRHEPLPEKVSGIDLTMALAELAARKGYPMFLLGAAPGVAEQAAENLKARFNGLEIAGTCHGYFNDDEQVVEQIASSGAKILLVAMGIPKQEKWIADRIERLNVPVAIGVGGTFDVLSGRVKRAPDWMRRRGLEWVHRLISNPRKIHKVAMLPEFLWLVVFKEMGDRS